MWVQFEPTLARVAANVSLREISVAQGASLADPASLAAAASRQGDYILGHLRLSVGQNNLSGKIVRMTPPAIFAEPEETFYQYEIEYPYRGSMPRKVAFFEDMMIDHPYAAGTPWNVSYLVRSKSYDSGEAITWLLPAGEVVTVATELPADQGNWRTFASYLHHGTMHILTGYDHLLFLCALVIATSTLWEMVEVILAFTIAHSITLALCVFGIFRLPPFLVEPVISFSIIFVALENVFWPQRSHSRLRLAVAFGFGLIHGLGFAGGLLEAMKGLPHIGIWTALVGFSLGVEIGNQMIALPLYGILVIGRRRLDDSRRNLLIRSGSIIIAILGVYYLIVALREQVLHC
jgi:hypothetical protein